MFRLLVADDAVEHVVSLWAAPKALSALEAQVHSRRPRDVLAAELSESPAQGG